MTTKKQWERILNILPQATPTLKGKEATNFMKSLIDAEKNKVGLVPTPKLKEAEKLIEQYIKQYEVK